MCHPGSRCAGAARRSPPALPASLDGPMPRRDLGPAPGPGCSPPGSFVLPPLELDPPDAHAGACGRPQASQFGVDAETLQGALEALAGLGVLEVGAGGGRLDAPAADPQAAGL